MSNYRARLLFGELNELVMNELALGRVVRIAENKTFPVRKFIIVKTNTGEDARTVTVFPALGQVMPRDVLLVGHLHSGEVHKVLGDVSELNLGHSLVCFPILLQNPCQTTHRFCREVPGRAQSRHRRDTTHPRRVLATTRSPRCRSGCPPRFPSSHLPGRRCQR